VCIVIISRSAEKFELLNPVVLAGPVIPMVSTETNTGKSANIWHQEIKKRGGGPSGKRIGGNRAPKTLLIWLTCMLHHGKKINLVTLCTLF